MSLLSTLSRCIAELPPRLREVFLLVDVLGRSPDVAASCLDLPVDEVRVRCGISRVLLRAMLKRELS